MHNIKIQKSKAKNKHIVMYLQFETQLERKVSRLMLSNTFSVDKYKHLMVYFTLIKKKLIL